MHDAGADGERGERPAEHQPGSPRSRSVCRAQARAPSDKTDRHEVSGLLIEERKWEEAARVMRFSMPSKANRRSVRSAGHLRSMLTGSALVAWRRLDRWVDADIIASGLRGDFAGIPPHLPIPLGFARPDGRAGSGRSI